MPNTNPRARAAHFIIRSRADRKMYFAPQLFSDPAWDMLLSLYAAALEQKALTVSRLSEAAGVGLSTVQRWLRALEGQGMIVRATAGDSDEEVIGLSEKGWLAADSYFENLSSGMI